MCLIKIKNKTQSEITNGPNSTLGSGHLMKVSMMEGSDHEAHMPAFWPRYTHTHTLKRHITPTNQWEHANIKF